MRRITARSKWIALCAVWLILTGCASNTAPTRFYMITPQALPSPGPAAGMPVPPIRIALEPVAVPEYLNRPHIVTQLDRVEYRLDEFNRWAEPLGDNLTRVIAENLTMLLHPDAVDVLPMTRFATDYRVGIQVLRLDGRLGGQATLVARWTIFHRGVDAPLVSKRSIFRETAEDGTYRGLVLAANRMIDTLCLNISAGVKQVLADR